MVAESEPTTPGTVQSMERGLAVIRAFDADHRSMTLSEVSRRTDLTRATTRRFLHTLVALDYMETDGRQFWLRPRILELGYAYLSSLTLPEIANEHLKNLSDLVHESSSVSVLDGKDIVYVARIPARRIMAVAISVGTRFPAYVTSMGRVLLAELPADRLKAILDDTTLTAFTESTITERKRLEKELRIVREQGYAVVDQELERGLRSIATGIRNRAGETIAALNISVPSSQVPLEEIHERMLPHLLATRDAIEQDLSARYPAGTKF
jgi:IclR family pca regulon transcriptional regulator